jgi:biotin operon repressor/anti-sigma regulatory factor (Ser/Thr protein kinase)
MVMGTRDRILDNIRMRGEMTGPELSELLGMSRQAVNKHLRALIRDGTVVKVGVTRGAVYRHARRKGAPAERRRRKTYALKGLEEDKVFQESSRALGLRRSVTRSAWEILSYAFTEMLNNAIEHSESGKCDVVIAMDQYTVRFNVRDFGIGILNSIATKFNLADESEAVGELIKGKTTTMKERHSGEGVFFTSKCADRLSIRSHRVELVFDNQVKDVFVSEKRFLKGTEVEFEIRRRSRRSINEIFAAYAPEEFGYRFETTRVHVKLFQKEYVSRSEARRLLMGLDRFKRIKLDFRGVKSMGQGFADEVFRVFLDTHADIHIETESLSHSLRAMVLHVVDNKSKSRLTIG